MGQAKRAWGSGERIKVEECCWPECGSPQGTTTAPLCNGHLITAWKAAQVVLDTAVRTRPKPQGYVYCIRFGDRLKIGYTEHLQRRLGALPHEEVIGVVAGTPRDEAACHRLFADLRLVGEWFQDDPQIREFVAAWR